MVQLSAPAVKEIQAIITEAVQGGKTPGLVFGATSSEKELCFIHAGNHKYGDPSSEAMSSESTFWICSTAKLVVSIAALQLCEKGKLQFDEPVTNILPELVNPIVLDEGAGVSSGGQLGFRPATEVMKIRHLFNHSSGLFYPRDPGRIYSAGYDPQHAVQQFFELIKGDYPGVPLKHEPGTSFAYGWSTDVLGFVLEKITGGTLEQYCKENIFLPLNIKTSFHLTPDLKSRLVSIAFRKRDGEVSSVVPSQEPSTIEQDPKKINLHLGGTGIYSSMRDYLTILRHILQILDGSVHKPILSFNTARSLFRPCLTPSGEQELKLCLQPFHGVGDSWSSALCVNTSDIPRKRKRGSGWWYGWLGTYYFIDPETGVAAVLGSQLLPTLDPGVLRLWDQCEQALYGGLC